MNITVTVNGQQQTHDVEPRLLLVHYIREVLGLTGTNVGCDTSSCGACSVHLDGEAVKSCTVLAVQADGASVQTMEGLSPDPEHLHPVAAAFRAEHGLQCGFCTPGMVMAAVSLLEENPRPTEREVREGLEGNLCRCTGRSCRARTRRGSRSGRGRRAAAGRASSACRSRARAPCR